MLPRLRRWIVGEAVTMFLLGFCAALALVAVVVLAFIRSMERGPWNLTGQLKSNRPVKKRRSMSGRLLMGSAWSDPWTPLAKEQQKEEAPPGEAQVHRSRFVPGELHTGPRGRCRHCRPYCKEGDAHADG
ncbi:hypothetical protein LCGC14_1123740 [marine sediment metagenome]|uniref:Uncharacterized protein n=1 Tax=marine sediment metagenome TaxID=412755 RepID=A0A0F9Q931_9ZZZZ